MNRKMFLSILGIISVLLINPNNLVTVNAQGNDQPRVIVTGYEAENGGIAPGETTKIKVTLKNTNPYYTAYSIVLTCTSDSPDIFTKYGTANQVYVDSLTPGQEKTVELSLSAAESLDSSVNGKLNVIYKDDVNGDSSSDIIISIPLKEDALKIKRVYVPQSVMVGAKTRISITCENNTTEEIYNAVMEVKIGDMTLASADIGTVINGSRKSPEVYVLFNSLGEQNITIQLSYIDAQGQIYTKNTQEYQIDIVDKDSLTVTPNQAQDNALAIQDNFATVKQLGYFAGIFIFGVAAAILIVKKKKY